MNQSITVGFSQIYPNLRNTSESCAKRCQGWIQDRLDIFMESGYDFVRNHVVHESRKLDDLVLPSDNVAACCFKVKNE